jgi:hypothetical protein
MFFRTAKLFLADHQLQRLCRQMDISQRTGQYLHGPDDIYHLSFPTGGVPRSFSVVAYSAREKDEIDLSDNGVAIIYNYKM